MTHDPLCSFEVYHTTDVCECSLIAKVRADEREKAAQRVHAQRSSFRARDWDDAIEAATAAARREA